MTRFFAAVGRHRRVILAIGLAATVGYAVAIVSMPALTLWALGVLAMLSLCLLVLEISALRVIGPLALEVRPQVPAFTAPTHPEAVFRVLLTFLAASLAVTNVRLLVESGSRLVWLLAPSAVLGVVAAFFRVWRGVGIELRPDGLRDRAWAGVLIVPWDAMPVVPLPLSTDNRRTLRVRYARPELVRRRGLVVSRRRLLTENVDQRLVARIIRYYTTHPERRPSIGSQAEYDRLIAELANTPDADL